MAKRNATAAAALVMVAAVALMLTACCSVAAQAAAAPSPEDPAEYPTSSSARVSTEYTYLPTIYFKLKPLAKEHYGVVPTLHPSNNLR
ncbi:hypothetical protein R1flu_026350 [Riccia fluitans]|uniref:Uncharacterized protein n=1 Tax=Riccia fluitans TaxID=41844 RepID=A0ABD1XFQ3_9MARC